MIGIEVIQTSSVRAFAPLLEVFLNEHKDAKILMFVLRGIEGGKGVVAVLQYEKVEEELIPEPILKVISAAQKKIDAEAESKAIKLKEEKKAKLQAQLEQLKE